VQQSTGEIDAHGLFKPDEQWSPSSVDGIRVGSDSDRRKLFANL
jgi:hypothetical protein